MTTLTPAQIAQVAANAGFTGTGLVRAVACALAESGGNPTAVYTNKDGSRDRGLWQFNSKYHPEVSDAAAFNPATAAAAAYTVSKGGASWTAWATWSNGRMAAQMGRAQLAAASVKSGGTNASDALWGIPGTPSWGDIENGLGDVVPGLTGGITDGLNSVLDLTGLTKIGEAVVKTAVWMANPHNWLRVLEVMAGAGVVILGVKMLADSGVGGPVGAAARGAAQAPGKVSKAAVKVAAAVATDGASTAATAATKTAGAASKTASTVSKTASAAKGAAKSAAKGAATA